MRIAKSAALATLTALALAACATGPGNDSYTPRYADSGYSTEYGRVVGIEPLGSPGGTTGAGAVVGGIVGGVLGHQVGSGRGNDAATVAGAIGGAIVGNQVERNRAGGSPEYRIAVRLDGGGTRSVVQQDLGDMDLRVGDRVRIENGRVYRS